MPYISDTIRLPDEYNRRKKLTQEDVMEIRKLYATGDYTWRSLAAKYHVSKTRIGQLVNPSVEAYNKMNHEKYAQEHVYSKIDRIRQKKYRKYKHELYLEGKIKLEDKKGD